MKRICDGRIRGAALPSGSSTHLPALMAALAETKGPVLECGVGDWSTPILHEVCRGRMLTSLDSESEWVENFAYLRSDGHQILHSDLSPRHVAMFQCEVAFVDCRANLRVPIIHALALRARLIVIHDVQVLPHDDLPMDRYGLLPACRAFRHCALDTRYWPSTAIVSNREPFPFTDWSLP